MDLKIVQDVIELMKTHRLAEIDIEQDGRRVRVVQAHAPVQAVHAFAPAPAPAAPSADAPPEPDAGPTIDSPLVGTFYRAPSPESPAFVKAGDEVEEGTVLCIVEAMKVMNEIKAELKARVVEVLVENGHPVEFGQPLFRIVPLG